MYNLEVTVALEIIKDSFSYSESDTGGGVNGRCVNGDVDGTNKLLQRLLEIKKMQ